MYPTSARPAPLDLLFPSAPPAYGIDRRKDIGLAHSSQPYTGGYLESSIRDGLHTPPGDDMAATFPSNPQYSNYTGRKDSTYSVSSTAGASHASNYLGAGVQAKSNQPRNQIVSSAPASTLRNEIMAIHTAYDRASPITYQGTNSLAPPEGLPRRKSTSSDMIVPNLQIPSTINNSGGSLAEFAAQITCLFWFESTDVLHKAEELSHTSSPVKRLKDEALPSSGFRKWVVTILTTTQVTQNVILLALLFIYRLKKINPAVKGRSGSEYRLLTVALMLGNKFLDDNTYTNKTWAEVSGISVTEIHVMEVEFLSNMRYSLLASEDQWLEWQEKLGKFWIYCDRASKAPTHPALYPTLPSPPGSLQSSPPSSTGLQQPIFGHPSYGQGRSAASHALPLVSPLTSKSDYDLRHQPRKRSYDGDMEEPVSKRISRPSSTAGPLPVAIPPIRTGHPRLPVPNLTISTTQPSNNNFPGNQNFPQSMPVLPPLNGRAMSTVYPSTPSWTPQLPMLTPSGPTSQNGPHSASSNGYVTPSRRHSPHSVHELLSIGSSPISANFPNHNSPSFFLQQRNSPYKPVRHVNTLLYPPPSTSMHNYSANMDQIHYQPLGKRNDYRSGVVPSYQPWPLVLPQPNFDH